MNLRASSDRPKRRRTALRASVSSDLSRLKPRDDVTSDERGVIVRNAAPVGPTLRWSRTWVASWRMPAHDPAGPLPMSGAGGERLGRGLTFFQYTTSHARSSDSTEMAPST
jgi:hypothetical protein